MHMYDALMYFYFYFIGFTGNLQSPSMYSDHEVQMSFVLGSLLLAGEFCFGKNTLYFPYLFIPSTLLLGDRQRVFTELVYLEFEVAFSETHYFMFFSFLLKQTSIAPPASATPYKALTRCRCSDYHLQIHLRFITYFYLILHSRTFCDNIDISS